MSEEALLAPLRSHNTENNLDNDEQGLDGSTASNSNVKNTRIGDLEHVYDRLNSTTFNPVYNNSHSLVTSRQRRIYDSAAADPDDDAGGSSDCEMQCVLHSPRWYKRNVLLVVNSLHIVAACARAMHSDFVMFFSEVIRRIMFRSICF